MSLKYLHTMVRVNDLEKSMEFYCNQLGLEEAARWDYPDDKFTLVMLAASGDHSAQIELTYNYGSQQLDGGRNFGHLAYSVSNIYELCQKLMEAGITINRPPRDGHMAFIRSPDNISVELLQEGEALPVQEPWASMPNVGEW